MSHAFPNLFTSLQLRHTVLKNRVSFGAHTANMSKLGLPAEQHLGYYLERAIGGAAMIVVEPVPVNEQAVLTRGNFLPGNDAVIPGFRAITDACHEYDTVMIHQLYHVGQQRRVLLVDDLNDWRGTGTATLLAENGYDVTLVTSAAVIAGGLTLADADVPLRKRYARAGGKWKTNTIAVSWAPGRATLRCTLTGDEEEHDFDALVVASLPEPVRDLSEAAAASGSEVYEIGDCVAARKAVMAIYEGRKLAMSL